MSSIWLPSEQTFLGRFCAVKGCHNSYRKLKNFLDQECYEHKPTIRAECQCPRPFKLHKMPSDDESKRQWLAALNLKFPPRNVNVCSFHFVDRHPTTENPHPEVWLGYDRPLRKQRRQRTCPDKGETIHLTYVIYTAKVLLGLQN